MTDFRQIYNEMSDQMHGNQKKFRQILALRYFLGTVLTVI